MGKSKANNQKTRKDRKLQELKNNEYSEKKPNRLPINNGFEFIGKITKMAGSRRFDLEYIALKTDTKALLVEHSNLTDGCFESIKLKGSIRSNSKSRININDIVLVSYGLIEYKYERNEVNYITKFLEETNKEDDNISFYEDTKKKLNYDNSPVLDTVIIESKPVIKIDEDINLDDI